MRQFFFDARTGKEVAKPDDSGKGDNRILAMLKKLVGAEASEKPAAKPTPKPTPGKKPVYVKKVYDNSIDPDTGEPKGIKYDAKKKTGVPPRSMPRQPKPQPAPQASPFVPKGAAAPQVMPKFDPSVIPGPDGGPTGAGGKMGGSPPEPPSQQGGGSGHAMKGRPPSPAPAPRPVPPIVPPVAPPNTLPPVAGPPLPQSTGGQIFDGKKIRYDGQPKVKKVMDEWKSGQLHSGSKSGPVVKNQKQAVAIALSEARKKSPGSVPPAPPKKGR